MSSTADPDSDRQSDVTDANSIESKNTEAKNFEHLKRFPVVLALMQETEPYPHTWVERSKSGDPVLCLPDPQGGGETRSRPLHSRHRPREEGRRQLPKDLPVVGTCIFLGAGLGYAPLAYCEQMSAENTLVWLEPDPQLFRTALQWVDLTAVLSRPETLLLVAGDGRDLHELLIRKIQRLLTAPIKLVPHPASWERDSAALSEYRQAIQDFTREGAVQVRTALYLSRFSIRNQSTNLGVYVASPGYRYLRGCLAGKAAILVSAGPSLERNIAQLKDCVGRIPIIAVSTALKPLLSRGIRPDFTALIDYHRISKRYFEGINAEEAPPMVCDLRAAPEAVAAYPGTHLFGNDLTFNTLLEGMPGDRGELPNGSTVAHAAYHFLRYLGADPIVLVGQDLSYPGGLVHVPGTSIQTQEFPSTHRFYSLEMRELEHYYYYRKKFKRLPGNRGGEVPTDDIFFTYIREFERMFAQGASRVLNATEGGARLEGAAPTTLAEVIETYGNQGIPDLATQIRAAVESCDPAAERAAAKQILLERMRDLRKLQRNYTRILELLPEVIRANRRGKSADQKVERVHRLHRDCRQYGRVFLLLSNLAQSDGWRRVQDDRELEASQVTGLEKQRSQAQRDRRFVKGLSEAASFLEECFEAAIDSCEDRSTDENCASDRDVALGPA